MNDLEPMAEGVLLGEPTIDTHYISPEEIPSGVQTPERLDSDEWQHPAYSAASSPRRSRHPNDFFDSEVSPPASPVQPLSQPQAYPEEMVMPLSHPQAYPEDMAMRAGVMQEKAVDMARQALKMRQLHECHAESQVDVARKAVRMRQLQETSTESPWDVFASSESGYNDVPMNTDMQGPYLSFGDMDMLAAVGPSSDTSCADICSEDPSLQGSQEDFWGYGHHQLGKHPMQDVEQQFFIPYSVPYVLAVGNHPESPNQVSCNWSRHWADTGMSASSTAYSKPSKLKEETCQHCGSMFLPGTSFCRNCGSMRHLRVDCHACGLHFLPDTHFCRRCGAKRDILEGQEPIQASYSHPTVPKGTQFRVESEDTITTMMLQKIPSRYHSLTLAEELNHLGFRGKMDFVYVPIDLKMQRNVGYGFVNFTTAEAAEESIRLLSGRKLNRRCSGSILVVPAHMQGLRKNLEHYGRTAVQFNKVQKYRPVVFVEALSHLDAKEKESILSEFGHLVRN